MLFITAGQVKRESGAIPERCRHCVRELLPVGRNLSGNVTEKIGKAEAAVIEARRPACTQST